MYIDSPGHGLRLHVLKPKAIHECFYDNPSHIL